jgi:hypothetical protein
VVDDDERNAVGVGECFRTGHLGVVGVVQADVPADRAPDSGEDIDGDEPGVSAAVEPIRYALVAALWERWARPWPTITPILGDIASDPRLCGGRSWDRTSDPLLVREVLYR